MNTELNHDNPLLQEQELVGKQLCQARTRLGMTLDQIASNLNLDPEIINSLENDEYDQLPAPTFVRGYIRAYATIVGLSADPLIVTYNQQHEDHQPQLIKPPTLSTHRSGDKLLKIATILILTSVVILSVIWWLERSMQGQQASQSNSPEATATQGSDLSKNSEINQNELTSELQPQPSKPDQKKTISEPAGEVVRTKKPEADSIVSPRSRDPGINASASMPNQQGPKLTGQAIQQEAGSEASHGEEFTAPHVGQASLKIEFKEDCWVEIRDSQDTRLMLRIAKAGSTHRVAGIPPFRVKFGNAPAVQMWVDNQPYDLRPHIKGKLARFELNR